MSCGVIAEGTKQRPLVQIVRLWIHRLPPGQSRLDVGVQPNPYLACNCCSDLALQVQHVLQVAIVARSPEMFVCAGLDQLRRNAGAIAGTHNRPFDDGIDVQLASDLRE